MRVIVGSKDEVLIALFKEFIAQTVSIVVFRSSPLQKAQIVRFVKDNVPGAFTLSVGDGSNDVNMIQTAHVGIGLYGKEGEQAASFSDYALPEFRFMQRLLLSHGR